MNRERKRNREKENGTERKKKEQRERKRNRKHILMKSRHISKKLSLCFTSLLSFSPYLQSSNESMSRQTGAGDRD